MTHVFSRRRALAAGMGIGSLAFLPPSMRAQIATPVASPEATSLGFASLRIRQLAEASFRTEVNELVIADFAPQVQELTGYSGYVLGDVVDDDTQSLSIVVLEQAVQADAFASLAEDFVSGLDPQYAVETPTSAEGDLLITTPATTSTTATPVPGSGSYIAVRIYDSLPGTNPRDFVPLAIEGFVPIVTAIGGFQGYLLMLVEGGFASISLFDSEASALESTTEGTEWAAENLAAFTPGDPHVITATGVFVDLPILNRGQPPTQRA